MGLKRAAQLDENFESLKRPKEIVSSARSNHVPNGGECPICRSLLIQKCIQCTAAGSSQTPCVLSFGGCGCVFHHHCVGSWLYKSYVCPVHETPWQPSAPRLCPGLCGVVEGVPRQAS
uniref:Zinc finger RING-H2-type domain-containing protein n=1 Tax=Haptolina ericina TaxID=156174 RepID=A0A7S3F145_9EUKA|mmetsp:Transcript_40400/g.91573  ORF Transcript_40400/g.91573 Transcript_40400/m.91573 type:complete len:118 (+) Transcript_40400:116-469(+)